MSNRSTGYPGHAGPSQTQPEIQIIKLHKSSNGMGISIVAAKVYDHYSSLRIRDFHSNSVSASVTMRRKTFQGAGQDKLGIYIKSVVANGAADAVRSSFAQQ